MTYNVFGVTLKPYSTTYNQHLHQNFNLVNPATDLYSQGTQMQTHACQQSSEYFF